MDIDWNDSFQGMVSDVVDILPKVLLFLVILIVGWIIAKLLEKAVDAILERVGFDRLVERGGAGRMMAHSGYDPSSLAAKLVYLAALIITLQLAFGVFGPNPISDLLASIVAWLPLAFVAIIIMVIAIYLAGIVRDIVQGSLGSTSYGRFLAMAAYVVIIALGVIAALGQMGVAVIITGPILIAVLATIGGIAVVGLGGGLVVPMQRRWERILGNAEEEFSQRDGRQAPRDSSMPGHAHATAPMGSMSSPDSTSGPTMTTPTPPTGRRSMP